SQRSQSEILDISKFERQFVSKTGPCVCIGLRQIAGVSTRQRKSFFPFFNNFKSLVGLSGD
ncbi:MAG: hypothetical protein KDD35_13190, partial [Bdellovibrionales bacterium]|nr:hypothetical protein [Bdellovibrionales bacterium]